MLLLNLKSGWEAVGLKVKICGIQNVGAAKYAVECGADALGFVFAESKRRITAERAAEIIEGLPLNVWRVGVFVNESPDSIRKTARAAGLTHIQLHGDESADDYEAIGLPIIKSASVASKKDIQMAGALNIPYVLLDSPPGKYRGGSGSTFDWNEATGLGDLKTKIILAGGLNPENVQEAIAKIKPFMVDVSSGVETDGEKDFSKIKEFINGAKRAGEEIYK